MSSITIRDTQSTLSPFADLSARPSLLRVDPGVSYSPDLELRFLGDITAQLDAQGSDEQAVFAAVDRLCVECNRLRHHLSKEDWKDCVQRIRQSGILNFVHQDAFTHRAYSKPRGYAGDAVMMDLIYGPEEGWELPEMSVLGRNVHRYTIQASAPAGVRARREFIAELLDQRLSHNSHSRVLAVASGHLREASMSSAVRRRRFSEFVALDADHKSLQQVQKDYGRLGITTQQADIRRMLAGRLDVGQFDLVYSTGLYDYLNEKTGQKLTYHLFNLLNPGGKLVIANFLPSISDIGYMEACMDWYLVYRDRFDMVGLTRHIPNEAIGDLRIHTEENQNIIFLELTHAL